MLPLHQTPIFCREAEIRTRILCVSDIGPTTVQTISRISGADRNRTDASRASIWRAQLSQNLTTLQPHSLSSRWDSNSHYPGSRPGNLIPIGLLLVISMNCREDWTRTSIPLPPMQAALYTNQRTSRIESGTGFEPMCLVLQTSV